MKTRTSGSPSRPVLMAVSLIAILACLFGIWVAARTGLSKALGRSARLTGDLTAADKAVALTPSDPDAHRIRADALYNVRQTAEALKEFELAVSLRPRDDYLWLQLAIIRDELRDSAGAIAAFDESVRLAPYYAYPRWQRGNFLLRQGRLNEAFADMRHAAVRNPDYVPSLIDLAWGISKGDAKITEDLAQITTPQLRVAFAGFLARKGKARAALEQLAQAGEVSDQKKRELVRQLISAGAFYEAFEIWHVNQSAGEAKPVTIHDGGFEGALSFEESGFGWHISRSSQAANLAADIIRPHSGSKSLLIEFNGDSNPDAPLVSQLILVEPSRHYRVNFAARTQEIVTGGLPQAVVSDAAGEHKRLGESAPLSQDTTDWQVNSFDFQTEPATKAVGLSIQRKRCTMSPCPIFGSIWLDSFSIEALK